jgi:hypothetical protein
MSRTFRRRNAEQLMSNHGGKIAGVYTEVDYEYCKHHGHWCLAVYREPTKRERYETWRGMHGEKGQANYRFQRGVPKWGRKAENRDERSKNEVLISEFLKGITDDVVPFVSRRHPMHYW